MASLTRSQWTALSIRDRIRAMNETLDHVEHIPPPKFDVGSSTSFASSNGYDCNTNQQPDMTVDLGQANPPRRASVVDIWRKREESVSPPQDKHNGGQVTRTLGSAPTFDDEKKEDYDIEYAAQSMQSISVKSVWEERATTLRPANPNEAATSVLQQPSWAKKKPVQTSYATTSASNIPETKAVTPAYILRKAGFEEQADFEIAPAQSHGDVEVPQASGITQSFMKKSAPAIPESLSMVYQQTDSRLIGGPSSFSDGGTDPPVQIDSTSLHLSAMKMWKDRTSAKAKGHAQSFASPLKANLSSSPSVDKDESAKSLQTSAAEAGDKAENARSSTESNIMLVQCSSQSINTVRKTTKRPSVLDRWLGPQIPQTVSLPADGPLDGVLVSLEEHANTDNASSVNREKQPRKNPRAHSSITAASSKSDLSAEEWHASFVPAPAISAERGSPQEEQRQSQAKFVVDGRNDNAEKQNESKDMTTTETIRSELPKLYGTNMSQPPFEQEASTMLSSNKKEASTSRSSVFVKWQLMANATSGKGHSLLTKAPKADCQPPLDMNTLPAVNLRQEERPASVAVPSMMKGNVPLPIEEQPMARRSPATPTSTQPVSKSPASPRFPAITGKMHRRVKGRKFVESMPLVSAENKVASPSIVSDEKHVNTEAKSSATIETRVDTKGEGATPSKFEETFENSNSSPSTPSRFISAWNRPSSTAKTVRPARLPTPTRKRHVSDTQRPAPSRTISSSSSAATVTSSKSSAFAAWNPPTDSPPSPAPGFVCRKDKLATKRIELVKLGRKHIFQHGYLSKAASADAKPFDDSPDQTPIYSAGTRKSKTVEVASQNFEHLGKQPVKDNRAAMKAFEIGEAKASRASSGHIRDECGQTNERENVAASWPWQSRKELSNMTPSFTLDKWTDRSHDVSEKNKPIQSQRRKQKENPGDRSDPGDDLRALEKELNHLYATANEKQGGNIPANQCHLLTSNLPPKNSNAASNGIVFSSTTRNILNQSSEPLRAPPDANPSEMNLTFFDESFSMASTLVSSQSIFSGTSSLANRAGKVLLDRRRRQIGTHVADDNKQQANAGDTSVLKQQSCNMFWSQPFGHETTAFTPMPPKQAITQNTTSVVSPQKRQHRAPTPEIVQLKEDLRLTNRYNAASRYMESTDDETNRDHSFATEEAPKIVPDRQQYRAHDVVSIGTGYRTNATMETSCYSTVQSLDTYTTMENSESIIRPDPRLRHKQSILSSNRPSRREKERPGSFRRRSFVPDNVASEEFMYENASNVQACRSACETFSLQQIAADLTGDFRALGLEKIASTVNDKFKSCVNSRVEHCSNLNPFDDEDVAIEVEYMGESLDDEDDDPRDDLGPCSPLDNAFRLTGAGDRACARACYVASERPPHKKSEGKSKRK